MNNTLDFFTHVPVYCAWCNNHLRMMSIELNDKGKYRGHLSDYYCPICTPLESPWRDSGHTVFNNMPEFLLPNYARPHIYELEANA